MKPLAVFVACYWIDERCFVLITNEDDQVLAEFSFAEGENTVSPYLALSNLDNIVGCVLEPAPRKDGMFLFMSACPQR